MHGTLWTGDLQKMCTATWVEESDIVALAFSENGYGRVWFNLARIHPSNERVIWHWGRKATSRQPFAVLYARDIPAAWNDDREEVPA